MLLHISEHISWMICEWNPHSCKKSEDTYVHSSLFNWDTTDTLEWVFITFHYYYKKCIYFVSICLVISVVYGAFKNAGFLWSCALSWYILKQRIFSMQLVSLKGAEEATLVAQCIRGSVVSAAVRFQLHWEQVMCILYEEIWCKLFFWLYPYQILIFSLLCSWGVYLGIVEVFAVITCYHQGLFSC